MNDFTIDNIIDVLADFVEPICGKVQQAQVDRIPMPKGQFCIMTPLKPKRLSTTREIKQDTGDPATSAMGYTEVRQLDIQIDIYGDGAADRATALETVFSSDYAYQKIKSIDNRLAPLYTSDAFNAAMINGESQYQERWTITVTVQPQITVTVPQDYFDQVNFKTEQADKANP